ncbi:MAG TPA: ROK family transcriptional regulator [Galbitalea sp.]|nr:ROK family transcriptional regulator [Galbitalea sp.]
MQVATPSRDSVSPARRALRVTSKALPEHNRFHNRSLILQTLFHGGEMSRADLARESGLTRVTVSDLVSELSAEGIVEDLGTRVDTRVGKPATLVGIRPNAFHIITLDLSSDERFVGVVVNLRGEILHRAETHVEGKTGEDAIALVIDLYRRLAELATVRILGVGVGTPGIVDDHGVIQEAPNLGWYGIDLRARLAAEHGGPVYVGNDANAAALGVHTFHEASDRSIMVVTIEHGVGVGLIIGGSLVVGDQFAAGEIGHLIVDENGELCACGRRGCLELSLAAPHLRKRLADAGSGERAAILGDAGRSLGVALAPIVSALNLNDIVLCGPPELLDGPLLDAARDTIRTRTLSAVSNGLDMRMAKGGEDLRLVGAAAHVLSAELGVS